MLMSPQDETTPQLSLGKQVFHSLVQTPTPLIVSFLLAP